MATLDKTTSITYNVPMQSQVEREAMKTEWGRDVLKCADLANAALLELAKGGEGALEFFDDLGVCRIMITAPTAGKSYKINISF